MRIRRTTTALVGAAAMAAALAACSSGTTTPAASSGPASPTASAATATPTGIPTPVTEPIVLEYGTATATAAVGQAIDFDVEVQQADWTIKSSDPAVVSVTPGSSGTAVMNPGGMAVAPGKAKVTLTLPGGGKIWFAEVTVTD